MHVVHSVACRLVISNGGKEYLIADSGVDRSPQREVGQQFLWHLRGCACVLLLLKPMRPGFSTYAAYKVFIASMGRQDRPIGVGILPVLFLDAGSRLRNRGGDGSCYSEMSSVDSVLQHQNNLKRNSFITSLKFLWQQNIAHEQAIILFYIIYFIFALLTTCIIRKSEFLCRKLADGPLKPSLFAFLWTATSTVVSTSMSVSIYKL